MTRWVLGMPGSSSVPQELLAEIREFGGDMKETYRVPVEEIVIGIKHGVRKVNIDTDIRLAMTGAIRRFLAENPSKFDPREFLKPAREAAKNVCLARYQAFGYEGRAAQIKAVPLEKMAQRFLQGRGTEPDRQLIRPRPRPSARSAGGRPFLLLAGEEAVISPRFRPAPQAPYLAFPGPNLALPWPLAGTFSPSRSRFSFPPHFPAE